MGNSGIMARTIQSMAEQYARQREMDRVALPLIESVGVGAAYLQSLPTEKPVVNYGRREVVYRAKRKNRQMELELEPSGPNRTGR